MYMYHNVRRDVTSIVSLSHQMKREPLTQLSNCKVYIIIIIATGFILKNNIFIKALFNFQGENLCRLAIYILKILR